MIFIGSKLFLKIIISKLIKKIYIIHHPINSCILKSLFYSFQTKFFFSKFHHPHWRRGEIHKGVYKESPPLTICHISRYLCRKTSRGPCISTKLKKCTVPCLRFWFLMLELVLIPKSMTFMLERSFFFFNSMFSGFKSLCRILNLWQ